MGDTVRKNRIRKILTCMDSLQESFLKLSGQRGVSLLCLTSYNAFVSYFTKKKKETAETQQKTTALQKTWKKKKKKIIMIKLSWIGEHLQEGFPTILAQYTYFPSVCLVPGKSWSAAGGKKCVNSKGDRFLQTGVAVVEASSVTLVTKGIVGKLHSSINYCFQLL